MSTEPKPDPNAGHGGSYVLDPKTGERTLVERTQDPADAPAPDADGETAAEA